jgi:hypothetical protein
MVYKNTLINQPLPTQKARNVGEKKETAEEEGIRTTQVFDSSSD